MPRFRRSATTVFALLEERSVDLMLRPGMARIEHLDELAWSTEVSLDAYGVLVGLRASDGSAPTTVRRVMPPGARLTDARVVDALYSVVVADESERAHVLYEDAERTAHSTSFDELLVALESRLHFKIAVCARTHLFVHAGVVGWNGGAIVLPGRTHAGKSSLVAALVRAGATYYSDEYAVLDDAGLVHPFARPLGVRDATGRSRPVEPATLGGIVGDAPLPVTMVIVTRHVAGADWVPRPMSPGETVLSLLENTLAAQSRPADALRILCASAGRATGLRGERGDASRVADQILSRCCTSSE